MNSLEKFIELVEVACEQEKDKMHREIGNILDGGYGLSRERIRVYEAYREAKKAVIDENRAVLVRAVLENMSGLDRHLDAVYETIVVPQMREGYLKRGIRVLFRCLE
ncbi:MAG: hypothetical protein Q8O89_05080 [Nanoarchaeota archaeon]|nr:hypothetical protein [Nanoarchaeota archaeon]